MPKLYHICLPIVNSFAKKSGLYIETDSGICYNVMK